MWVPELLDLSPLTQVMVAIVSPLVALAAIGLISWQREKPVSDKFEFHGNTDFQRWVVHHIRDIHREVGALLGVTQVLIAATHKLGEKVFNMATKDDVAQAEKDLEAFMDAAFANIHAKLDAAQAKIDALVAAGQTVFTADEVSAMIAAVRGHVPAGDVPVPTPVPPAV